MSAKPKHIDFDHPVRKLFRDHSFVAPYPTGVLEIPEQILGTSFFPGGTGLWCEGRDDVPQFPVGGIMVLGHNFDKVSGYKKSLLKFTETLEIGTWGNLLPVLERAEIAKEDCFFTNIYMGLKEEGSASGRFPGADCPDFVKRCEQFFITQIERQRPRTILALGREVPPFLARLSHQLSAWSAVKKWAEIDQAGPVACDVSFNGVPDHKCTVACLVHPSYRRSNIKLRYWGELKADDAENQMIRWAISSR
jgi:uracil-DNA glycosylase